MLFFPDHNPLLVSTLTWLVLIVISYASTKLAIKVQYVVMAVIALSLAAVLMTPQKPMPLAEVPLIGGFEKADFWTVFAIFFPAVTGTPLPTEFQRWAVLPESSRHVPATEVGAERDEWIERWRSIME